jgi:hypothetical protein
MVPFAAPLAALSEIPDPRRPQGRRYPLAHLLLFSVLAVLAGATSYRGILTFVGVHRERLNATFGVRLRRAPAVNTPRNLFLALDPADLEMAFRRHARGLHEAALRPGPPVVALDGKTLRRSFDHLHDRAAAHVLSAFAGEAALILAHREVPTAPDEAPAVPALVAELGLTGVLLTADAPHCRKTASPPRPRAATPCWSGWRATSPACTTPWSPSAPSGSPSTGSRRSTAAGTGARSTAGSRSSRWRAASTGAGGHGPPARPGSRA